MFLGAVESHDHRQAGQPFIDVRLSFNSFLPAELPDAIGEKLVNHWLERIKKSPELHDKIEFDVAITTFSFDIDSKLENLIGDALTIEEKACFKETLKRQTALLLKDENQGSIANALREIDILKDIQESYALLDPSENFGVLHSLIDTCIAHGTIPFSTNDERIIVAFDLMPQ